MLEELKEVQKTLIMSWPSPQDYNEALQDPSYSLNDPELAAGQTELDALGLPRPRSGMFASVYKVHAADRDWAVRCFLQAKADQISRYVQIRNALHKASSTLSCLVPFDLLQEGIRISGHRFPILKMQWCHGDPLNVWLGKNLKNKAALETFLESWRNTLNSLQSFGIAHGDLQHGNILIEDGAIKLVDYDGIYIPEFKGMQAEELGHRSYQHPKRDESHFGPYLDNFSAWLIYISVLISGCDRHVWHDFEGGDECLLFRKEDLDDPLESELFHVLEHHHNPQIRECSRTLRYLLTLSPEHVPGLDAPVLVPDDFPILDSVISDLPDWVAPTPNVQNDPGSAQPSSLPLFPEGKRLMKRRRGKGVPLNLNYGDQNVRGRWLYDEHGLAFIPEKQEHTQHEQKVLGTASTAGANINATTLHSPLLDSYTSPAPYRNISGKLHSPILQDDSLKHNTSSTYASEYDRYGNFPAELKLAFVSVVIALFIGSIFFGSFFHAGRNTPPTNSPPAAQTQTNPAGQKTTELWPEGQYYRLLDGRIAMEDDRLNSAEDSFKQGIIELNKMPETADKRVHLNLAYIYDNLGKIHFKENDLNTALNDFDQSLQQWQGFSGSGSVDYANVLAEKAQVLTNLGAFTKAEPAYKNTIAIFQKNKILPYYDPMRDALQGYAVVLKEEHKYKEAAKILAMIPKDIDNTGDKRHRD